MKFNRFLGITGILFISLTGVASNNPALTDMLTGKNDPAPLAFEKNSYKNWSHSILRSGGKDSLSAFTDLIFEWYETERARDLPSQVYQDRDKIFIRVDRPRQETIELENQGEIEEATTIGAEVYAEMDGTPEQVLDAMLFRWGKPAGQWEGITNPPASPYAKRVEYFAANPEWGAGAFVNLSIRQNGGMVKDLNDRYFVLIRGNAQKGYDVLMQYVKPGGTSSTSKCFALAVIKPLGDGSKSSYKISTRYQGQNYSILGSVNMGRNQIGFNPQKAREVQLDFTRTLKELKDTGTIKNSGR